MEANTGEYEHSVIPGSVREKMVSLKKEDWDPRKKYFKLILENFKHSIHSTEKTQK